MKFVEISQGICININEITLIISSDDGLSCSIFVGDKEYPCGITYSALVNILQQLSEDNKKTMDKLDKYLNVATVQAV